MENKRGREFERIAKPDAKGVSQIVNLDTLPKELQVTNGCNYTRNGSYLAKKYNIEKCYEKGTINTRNDNQSCGIGKGKLVAIKLDGRKEEEK